jgi:CRISPR-associated protein Csm3
MELLEKDYLGGMGSRGYGKIRLDNFKMQYYPKGFFEGKGEVKTIANAKNLMEIIKRLC